MNDTPDGADRAPSLDAYLLALYRWAEWPMCGGDGERPDAPRGAGASFYEAAMAAVSDWGDKAARHAVADAILCDLARYYGHAALADLYEDIDCWYS